MKNDVNVTKLGNRRELAMRCINYYLNLNLIGKKTIYECNDRINVIGDECILKISMYKTLLKIDLDNNLKSIDLKNILLAIDILREYINDKKLKIDKMNVIGIFKLYDEITNLINDN